jgi:low affinity Fe/Cu permease
MEKIINGNGHTNGNGHHKPTLLEKISVKMTDWVGTPWSLILHTIFFAGIFILRHFGFSRDYVLLLLTTAVSLEAIYLSIFIQMSVNRATQSLEEVEEDIEDIQEESVDDEEAHKVLIHIGQQMKAIQQDLEYLRRSGVLKTPANTPRIRS